MLEAALKALDSLDKKDLGTCKTMSKPPPGVDDIFGGVMVLLAGINPNIIVQKTGKVREKERNWDASKKALLGNVNAFLDELKEKEEKLRNELVELEQIFGTKKEQYLKILGAIEALEALDPSVPPVITPHPKE